MVWGAKGEGVGLPAVQARRVAGVEWGGSGVRERHLGTLLLAFVLHEAVRVQLSARRGSCSPDVWKIPRQQLPCSFTKSNVHG